MARKKCEQVLEMARTVSTIIWDLSHRTMFRRAKRLTLALLLGTLVLTVYLITSLSESNHKTKPLRDPHKDLTVHKMLSGPPGPLPRHSIKVQRSGGRKVDIILSSKTKNKKQLPRPNEVQKREDVHDLDFKDSEDHGKLYADITQAAKLVVWYLIPLDMELEEEKDCGYQKCIFTTDVSNISIADAVIVNGHELSTTSDPIRPVRTSPNQIWMFYSKTPWSFYSQSFPKNEWDGIFNWTFTYDRDSDILASDTDIVYHPKDYKLKWAPILQQKTKQVLWFSDVCSSNTGREDYVKELSKYIEVDIIGICGKSDCIEGADNADYDDKDDQTNEALCYQQYMFYLSFENTFCKDYVTETFFKTFSHHIVPIVYGGNDYMNHYPKDLYINTDDFNSAWHLAKHLHHLMKNKQEYLKYLKRHNEYIYIQRSGGMQCWICSYLYDVNKHEKSYPSISTWMDKCTTKF